MVEVCTRRYRVMRGGFNHSCGSTRVLIYATLSDRELPSPSGPTGGGRGTKEVELNPEFILM